MYRISSNVVKISKGDAATFDLTIGNYTFLPEDVVKLSVFEKGSSFDDALLTLTAQIDEEANRAVFTVVETDTQFAEDVNKPTTYWYEVKLNGDQTVIGYDDNGPKEFIIYPAEVGDTNA